MILQRLVEYYDRLSADPQHAASLPRPGYSLQKISFCVVLNPDGTMNQIRSMFEPGEKKPIAQQLLVPGQAKPPGSGINPCFLWDNATYMLGIKYDDPKPERTREAFEAFREKHLALESQIQSPAYAAVCAFLRNWSPESVADKREEFEPLFSNFGVFRIAAESRFVHDDPPVISYLSSTTPDEPAERAAGFCLITGQRAPIARLHQPAIKGVRDAQSSGALLVSFNDNAYESFGKEQGENAPVSEAAAFKYTNALNHLLAADQRKVFLGDTTMTYWAERPDLASSKLAEDALASLWGGLPREAAEEKQAADQPAEDKSRANQVRTFLTQLRDGFASADAVDEADDTGFYVLGLSPNASRISVRFWYQATIAELRQRLARHMRDTNLVGKRDGDELLTVRRIVQVCGRAVEKNGGVTYDADAVPPILAGAVARAVLFGTPYPRLLLSSLLNRIRADSDVRHDRVAAIKACLIRTDNSLELEVDRSKEVLVALDTNRTEAAYVYGRLFALLEKIQSDSAGGELNATIKDRYFSAASATPSLVFPRLIRLSNHHLAKLESGQKVYYERQLGEAMGKIDRFSAHLTLEDQGLFAVGYFHQRQNLFTKRTKEDSKTEGAAA